MDKMTAMLQAMAGQGTRTVPMVPVDDTEQVCAEPLPLGCESVAQQHTALAQGRMLTELTRHKAWREVMSRWEDRVVTQRKRLVTTRDAAEVARLRIDVRAVEMAQQIVTERMNVALDAHRAIEKKDDPPHREMHVEWTREAALDAVRFANEVKELIALPGFKLWMRLAVARVWAHTAMLADCAPEEVAAHQEWANAIVRVMDDFQKALNLGADAETWISVQAESGSGKEL